MGLHTLLAIAVVLVVVVPVVLVFDVIDAVMSWCLGLEVPVELTLDAGPRHQFLGPACWLLMPCKHAYARAHSCVMFLAEDSKSTGKKGKAKDLLCTRLHRGAPRKRRCSLTATWTQAEVGRVDNRKASSGRPVQSIATTATSRGER
eukprot:6442921-Amphidinium_carterae.1